MFPVSVNGEFEVAAEKYGTIELLLRRIERHLRAARALEVRRSVNRVSFKGGFLRTTGNVLN